jgi:secretion/DNA translocation related TadE-like protein
MRPGPPHGGRERGSSTVLAVAAISVLLALTSAGLVLAGAVTASQHARLAADLAALAGARRLQAAVSEDAACAEARRVARLNRADVESCAVEGMDLEVVVAVPTSTWPTPASARARAGPYRETSTP